jgi:hypothetical protein
MDQSVQMITDVLKSMGVDPVSSQLPDSNGRGWLVQSDSIVMFVVVGETDNRPSLRLTCPILYMPAHDLLPFYRKMLDLNMGLISVALGMDRDVVCVVCQQSLEDLTASAVETLMKRTLQSADALGDLLIQEFPTARCWSPM